MELTSFILGVCAVIVLMMVVGTFVNYMTTMSLKKEINSLCKQLDYTNMEMEKQISQVYEFCNELNRNLSDDNQKLHRHIDSRVDKVVDNISHEIAYLNQTVDKLQNDTSVING